MKKLLAICLCLTFSFSIAGCSPGELVDRFVSAGDSSVEDTAFDKPRVYMDEVKGQLQDFTGNQLTVRSDETLYVFDVSQATLECADGMITGDEISVIYEGQLNDTDTSTVKALKVVDEFHKKNQLEDRTAHGQIIGLTPNTITIKSKTGKTATYPITGTEQYYQNGIKANTWVYLHYKGKFPEDSSGDSAVLNASHMKSLSISDIDPLKVPEPTPTPAPEENPEGAKQEQQMQAVIQDVNLNILQVQVQGTQTSLSLDMSAIPCYFKGGIAPGSHVTVIYQGEFNGTTAEGITLLGITGQNPEAMKDRNISSTVSGVIIGSTANTITIQTPDNALVTCSTANARNLTTGGLLSGSSVRITFNPAASRKSNIYTCLKIEDA